MKKSILRGTSLLVAAAFLPGAGAGTAAEFRRGVWAANDAAVLPLPTSGYQIYLIGEMHGVQENVTVFEAYLKLLTKSGIRDVAIEEDSVYERAAAAYVTGRLAPLPEALCLRAGVLDVVKRFNETRPAGQFIRIHLVDIDTPASAIRQHLAMLRDQTPVARTAAVPGVDEIKEHGLKTIEDLRRLLPLNSGLHRELRTIEYSIQAYRDGLEVGEGPFKGSPYLESREDAIAANLKRRADRT